MAQSEKVTVEKSYFDALLRRADFHTQTQLFGQPDLASVNISKVEYDSLLRASREYECLKNALFQGGIETSTLDLLISGAQTSDSKQQPTYGSNDSWAEQLNT